MANRQWPASRDKWDELEARAFAKFRPGLAKLQPWEVAALSRAVGEELATIREEAHAEMIASAKGRGVRIGR